MDATSFQLEAQAKERIVFQLGIEKNALWQESRIQWLKCGDNNSHFLHLVMKEIRAQNIIDLLFSEEGEMLLEEKQVK